MVCLSKYYFYAKVHILERLTYFWQEILNAFFIAMILFIFLNIWKVIYAGKPTIDGFSISQMIWYLAFAELLVFSFHNELMRKIGDEIRSGVIASSLLKPMSYIGMNFAEVTAKFIYTFASTGPLVFFITYFFVGPINITFSYLPLLTITVIGSMFLNFLIMISLGLFAFWFEDVSAFLWLYLKGLFILGGMLVPFEFYPAWLQGLKYLPFSFLMYLPAKLFIRFNWNDFLFTIAGQLIWTTVLFFIMLKIYKSGIKKVNVHGG